MSGLIVIVCLIQIVMSFKESRFNETRLASLHYGRVLREAKCKKPVPKVIHVLDVHPNGLRKYLPHCTVLHRCGAESGCCGSENQVCQPKTIELVSLYFWVIELSPKVNKKRVEKLTFENHTECFCDHYSNMNLSW